jgi:AcrR family transcriptional regulator
MELDKLASTRRPRRKAASLKPPPARGRKRQSERREDAMALILDSAEKLFAVHGRDAVTVRAIAKEAEVDPALVHYYFSDIDGVFRAVFTRKSEVINAIRNQAMDDYLAEHGEALTAEGVLDVFLRPVFQAITENPRHWAHYAAIVSYTVSLRRDYNSNPSRFGGRELMREAFDVAVHRFIDMLKQLAPNAPAEDIYWFYHQVAASLVLTLAQTGRIDAISGGLCKSSDMMGALDSMVRVFSAGFEAVKARSGRSPARHKR